MENIHETRSPPSQASPGVPGEGVRAAKSAPDPPAELCGFRVAATLAEKKTYLAIGPSGRGIVLKKLDDECILRGLLHPNIRERLSRVRELAHGGVANLHGVARDGDQAWLIWEYAEGIPFDQYAATPGRAPREIAIAARELALATSSLHLRGIVHGAMVAGNVIVRPAAGIRLTHVSPLLYNDPAVDSESVLALLYYVIELRDELQTPLGRILARARQQKMNLRELGGRLAAFIESRDIDQPADAQDLILQMPRRRALIGAAIVAFIGLAMAASIWLVVHTGKLEFPQSFQLTR